MADDNLNISNQNVSNAESIKDSMLEIKNATKLANSELQQAGELLADYGALYRGISSSASQVARIQQEASVSSKATSKAIAEQQKNLNAVSALNEKINSLYEKAETLTGANKTAALDQAKNLAAARDNAKALANVYGNIAEEAAKLDSSTAFFNGLSEIAGDIPGLRKLAGPFQDAAKAARQAVIANETNEKKVSVLGKGIKGFTKSISTSAKNFIKSGGIYVAIAKVIAKAIKFVVDLFIAAEKNTVAIANNLAISKDQAELLRKNFVRTADASGKLYVTSEKLIEAQSELVNQLERGGRFSENTLLAQTFLTKRLNMNASSAAAITSRFEAFGKNADKGINSIIDLNNNLIKSGENTATINQIMNSVSQASGQVAASFGFSNVEIAKGVILVRRFGLNLSQARTISENLLDFESSLNNELQTELFLGRDINLNRARAFALQGNIADATNEVMKITEGLTLEQQKSPLIMKSLAASIGLSVDELQDALLLEKDRGRQMQDRMRREREYAQYVRAIKSDLKLSKKAQEDFLNDKYKELGLDDANREQLEKNITSQQAFTEAIEKAKDSLSKFVNGGLLAKFTDLLTDFINRAAQVGFGSALLGFGQRAADISNNEEKLANAVKKGLISAEESSKLSRAAASPNLLMRLIESYPGLYSGMFDAKRSVDQKRIDSLSTKAATLDDFTIRANPKDTLVMAGGTRFGEETNTLLRELIAAVKEGGDVYIDGNKAGQALVMSSYKLG